METLIEHALEPEVAQPPPRRAHLSFGSNLLLCASALLFAVFLSGGAWALMESARLGWLAAAGRTLPARVVSIGTVPSEFKGVAVQQISLRYQYRLPDGSHPPIQTGTVRLAAPHPLDSTPLSGIGPLPTGQPVPQTFQIGDILPLRYAAWRGKPIIMLWPPHASAKIGFLLACGSMVAVVSVLLMRRLLFWRWHRLHLLRLGEATVGTIIHKHAQAEDAPRYYVRYGYASAGEHTGPVMCENEEQVTAEQWRRLEVGQPVTVLYDPARPGTAGLYSLLRRS